MPRFKLAGCVGTITLLLVSSGKGDVTPVSGALIQIDHLIQRLDDLDPVLRFDAVQRLMHLGEGARKALRLALPAASLQSRVEIDAILLHMNWVKPGDSQEIQQALTGYGDLDVPARCARVSQMVSIQAAAAPALLRILLNDPSPAVRWLAADAIRVNLDEENGVADQLVEVMVGRPTAAQMYLPTNENAPLLALAGWVYHETQPRRANDLLQQAVDLESLHPSAFNGQMNFVYLWLEDRAQLQHNNGRFIELLRRQAQITAWVDDRPPAVVTSLLAAQAEHGAAGGFVHDLNTYREYFFHAEVVYAIGRFLQRQGHATIGMILDDVALLMGGVSADDHLLAGGFLAEQGWNESAERELQWSLFLSDDKTPYVYFQLSALADERNDDLAAAHYLEAGIQRSTDLIRTTRYGQVRPWTADQAWAEVHWHYLRAARQAGDTLGAKMHLEKMLAIDQDSQIFHKNSAMASDIVPALQEAGQTDQADQIFKDAFKDLKQKINAAPEDAMPKNNLAWLCACSGKNLTEAESLAAQAVAAAPDDAACLDTQAEVYLRMGNPARALSIEARALQIKPDDVYMQKQLQKFRDLIKGH